MLLTLLIPVLEFETRSGSAARELSGHDNLVNHLKNTFCSFLMSTQTLFGYIIVLIVTVSFSGEYKCRYNTVVDSE